MSGRVDEFQQRGCDVLGISTDDIATHQRWLTTAPVAGGLGEIEFPLAADAEGATSEKYGVYDDRQRAALRGLFIIDPNGVLQYQVVHSLSVGRSSDEVLRVLDALQIGGLCPGEREIGAPTIDVLSSLQPGRVIGPYRVEEEIGQGSFGTVFRATDTLLNRTVALKILRRNEGSRASSFLAEARLAAALNHPHVCTILTVDASHGAEMIVMEFVEGKPLSAQLEEGPLPLEDVARLGRQVAEGMAAAHAAGIIHGDLKPGNLMVTSDQKIKIMDFGLARQVIPADAGDDTLPWSSPNSGLSGTIGYLAPEQVRGEEATTATDTFALGIVIYEMVSGQRAVSGKNLLDTLRRIEEFDASALVTELPTRFRSLLQQTLSQQPQERPSMQQIADQLA